MELVRVYDTQNSVGVTVRKVEAVQVLGLGSVRLRTRYKT